MKYIYINIINKQKNKKQNKLKNIKGDYYYV